MTLACRLLGHRPRFTSEGNTLVWSCDRKCEAGGAKEYETAGDAARYARAFDREDREDLGRRAPLIGLFPLRLFRTFRNRHRSRHDSGAQRS
ncbi:hypothetical protein [Actinomadura citrea]|uniref:Uncharacterized protein n=1 Tax=Actinomadura citrea TaxID=46158 RepID=A0A7Y9GB25_9ACTN|nr:hypothetical protein [Actinomadura citrea]NYE13188.1 hypothetical protein [Actinomadura citrea]GGU04622.1 hypothetical protein GCM10010177_74830 [Actinomadura citrea]